MNATKPGIDVPSTKPMSRAERRAEAARIQAEQAAAREAAEQDTAPPPTSAPTPESSEPPDREDTVTEQTTFVATVQLPMKTKPSKRPFATQVHASTLGRLEWVRRRGGVITDTVDAAINAYLDAAGVPQADEHGNIPE